MKIKVPYLTRLLEIKEFQAQMEEAKLETLNIILWELKEIKSILKLKRK